MHLLKPKKKKITQLKSEHINLSRIPPPPPPPAHARACACLGLARLSALVAVQKKSVGAPAHQLFWDLRDFLGWRRCEF